MAEAEAVAEVSTPDKIYGSLEDLLKSGGTNVEYKEIAGFKEGEKFRIGSVSAGDMIEWSEQNEGEAKRTAGLRLICKSLCGAPPTNTRFLDSTDSKVLNNNINTLRRLRHKETERIVKEILALNGMDVKKTGETKAESAAKND